MTHTNERAETLTEAAKRKFRQYDAAVLEAFEAGATLVYLAQELGIGIGVVKRTLIRARNQKNRIRFQWTDLLEEDGE